MAVCYLDGAVTTGTKTLGTNPFISAPPPNARWFYKTKTWNGANGKYDASGVLKDNAYTMNSSINEGKANSFGNWLDVGGSVGSVGIITWTANDDLRLNGKLLDAVIGHQLHLGIALGEGRKTIQMVSQSLTAIGGALREVKRGNLSQARRLLGMTSVRVSHKEDARFKALTLANRWLELQYGWKPLIRDVYSAMTAYALLSNPPRIWVITVKHNTPYRRATAYDASQKIRRNAKAKAMSTMKYSFTEVLSTPRSLGLYDPEAIAWEVMPWSFVIDWFIPIGSYLQQLNTVPKLSGKFVKSVFQVYDASAVADATSISYKGCASHREDTRLERTVTTGLTTKLPNFVPLDRIMSEARFYNSVALITQQLLRK